MTEDAPTTPKATGGIRLEHVSKVYGNGFRAVKDINLDIGEGEFMVLVGPSGCGKSTLLRMIAGLEEVSEGVVEIGGKRRHRRRAPRPRHRDGVPELRALPAHERAAEPRLRPEDAQDGQGRDQPARGRRREDPRPQRAARAQARPALRRPAPARRDGARHGARARRVPHGRAAVEPRRQAARRHARRARAPARAPRRDDGLRHPRPGRGHDARPAGGRAARRPPAAVRRAADAVRQPGQPVRGRLHRQPGDEPGRGDDQRRQRDVRRPDDHHPARAPARARPSGDPRHPARRLHHRRRRVGRRG